MLRLKSTTPPSYKPSGQVVVTIDGQDFYFGKRGSPEGQAKYDGIIAEWITNGRRLPGTVPFATDGFEWTHPHPSGSKPARHVRAAVSP